MNTIQVINQEKVWVAEEEEENSFGGETERKRGLDFLVGKEKSSWGDRQLRQVIQEKKPVGFTVIISQAFSTERHLMGSYYLESNYFHFLSTEKTLFLFFVFFHVTQAKTFGILPFSCLLLCFSAPNGYCKPQHIVNPFVNQNSYSGASSSSQQTGCMTQGKSIT